MDSSFADSPIVLIVGFSLEESRVEILPKGFRRCTLCKTVKPDSEFWRVRRDSADYRHGCKQCGKERAKERYLKKRAGHPTSITERLTPSRPGA